MKTKINSMTKKKSKKKNGRLQKGIEDDVGDIKTETDKIQMIKDDAGDIKTETDKIQMIKDDAGDIKTETDKIQMVKDTQYVPFQLTKSPFGTCGPTGFGESPGLILIENTSTSGTFIVTSVIVKVDTITATQTVRIASLIIDGDLYGVTNSGDLTGTDTFPQSFEVLGTPLLNGGNFPHQIVSNSAGSLDIRIEMRCASAGGGDVDFDIVTVSGWKLVADTITLT